MTKPGPRPQHTTVIKLHGGSKSSHRPLPEVIKTIAEAPTCPKFLRDNPSAKKHWDYIVKELKRYDMVSKIDQAALVGYATAYSYFEFAEEQIGMKTTFDDDGNLIDSGLIQTTLQGYQQPSPWWYIRSRALEQMIKIGDLFGMTPSGRVRVAQQNPNQGELELD